MNDIDEAIAKKKEQFILHNIVRLREMIRYLPPEKLNLFKLIPFLIHINAQGFPGYIKSSSQTFGIWNFKNTGFAKEFLKEKPGLKRLLSNNIENAAVQALYHIGSLGTFTQSEKSDFDYWVIINKSRLTEERYLALKQKLNLIIIHSRKKFAQEVSFFIHDAQALIKNQFANPGDDEIAAVPKLLIKEEFYRTFIMIAGKIPAWVVLPQKGTASFSTWKEHIMQHKEFIDLGVLDKIPLAEIKRGLLWQICKAKYDPVKSLIKASITASYHVQDNKSPMLTCDMIKERFKDSIIDDYAADPYIIAFEKILDFYSAQKDVKGLSRIKVAIFFRLCGFPMVALPDKESPKRKILDKYIRKWNLSNKRLNKLLAYQAWPEREKTVFDSSIINQLAQLYNFVEKQSAPTSEKKIESDLLVLQNKARTVLVKKDEKIPFCSIFLRIKPQKHIIIKRKETPGKSVKWTVFSRTNSSKKFNPVYSCESFLQTMGWIMGNHLYVRGTTEMHLPAGVNLHGSLDRKSDIHDIYMALQPWMPLSDNPFLSLPCWERVVLVMIIQEKNIITAEFIARNSWGEIFFETLNFEALDKLEQKCYLTARKIMNYLEINSQYTVFQLSDRPIPELIRTIKTIIEDKRKTSESEFDLSTKPRRPYLDTI